MKFSNLHKNAAFVYEIYRRFLLLPWRYERLLVDPNPDGLCEFGNDQETQLRAFSLHLEAIAGGFHDLDDCGHQVVAATR